MRRKNHSFRKTFTVAVMAVALVFIANYFIFKQAIQSTIYSFWQQPGVMLESTFLRIGGLIRNITDIEDIIKQNDQLKQENLNIVARLNAIESLERENDVLRRQLDVYARTKRNYTLGRIFHIERSPLGSVVFIDQGKEQFIQSGMAVVRAGDVLLGIIEEVYPTSSKVRLIDDSKSSVSIRVSGSSILATMKGSLGTGKGTGILDLVTSKDDIKEDDQIITSGLDGLPDGLVVGNITKIELSGGNLFQSVAVSLNFDPIEHSQIFVIKK